jgi:hypothetical protein
MLIIKPMKLRTTEIPIVKGGAGGVNLPIHYTKDITCDLKTSIGGPLGLTNVIARAASTFGPNRAGSY